MTTEQIKSKDEIHLAAIKRRFEKYPTTSEEFGAMFDYSDIKLLLYLLSTVEEEKKKADDLLRKLYGQMQLAHEIWRDEVLQYAPPGDSHISSFMENANNAIGYQQDDGEGLSEIRFEEIESYLKQNNLIP